MEVLPQASQKDKSSQSNRDFRYIKKNLSEFRNLSDYYFKKKPNQPSALQIDLDFEDYAYLMNDDLDEISKL